AGDLVQAAHQKLGAALGRDGRHGGRGIGVRRGRLNRRGCRCRTGGFWRGHPLCKSGGGQAQGDQRQENLLHGPAPGSGALTGPCGRAAGGWVACGWVWGAAGLGGLASPPPVNRFTSPITSIEPWAFSKKEPAVIILSSPPGVIERYWPPRKPAWVTSTEESTGSLMSLRTLICTVTR